MLRALFAVTAGDDYRAREPLHESLGLRMIEYLKMHLRDPDLNMTRLAKEHGISERYAYLILSKHGITLGDWVRSQRVEGAARDLIRADGAKRTIAEIAYSWGFPDQANFTRAFRRLFGESPREYRKNHLGSVWQSAAGAPTPAPVDQAPRGRRRSALLAVGRSSSSNTDGATTSPRPRTASSTTPTTCRPPACHCSRRGWPTSAFSKACKVDVKNPNRGPLLIISGTKDTTAPKAFTYGSYKKQLKNPETTEYVEVEDRGHSLVIDHGWPGVADEALKFAKRFA
jgi:AraC-like DNA-binding protein